MNPRFLTYISILFSSLLITHSSYSQWVVCTGTVSGLGTFPVISVPNCSTIVLAGGTPNNPRVMRSTNSGESFQNITGNMTGPELFCVWAKTTDTIFAANGGSNGGAGGNAIVWKTVNGGVNWTTALTTGGTAGFINGIKFVRPEQKFGVIMSDAPTGTNPVMYKTHDGGETWTPQTVTSSGGATGSVSTVFITDSLFYGFGHSSTSRISMTTNGGSNWSFLDVSLQGNTTYGIDCGPNRNCFVMALNLPGMVKFNDLGQTQTLSTGTGVGGQPYVIWIRGTETAYIAGTIGLNGAVKRTTDTGNNWTQMTTASVNSILGMDYDYNLPNLCAYALAGNGSNVLKLTEEVIGIQQVNNVIPKNYLLEQNYPNPFNPTTNINYSIPKSGNVTIKIYNTLGALVNTLVNEHHSAGNYNVNFDAGGLSSGIYYYTITAGEFTDTKKMVLIK